MRPRPRSRRRAAPALALAALLAGACASGGRESRVPTTAPTRYEELTPEQRARLEVALRDREDGRLGEALAGLEHLREELPDNLVVGIWLQETELAAARQQGAGEGEDDAAVRLRRRYRERAEERPSSTAFVLAARIEDDATSAGLLLDRALERDPRCAWAHYGHAHVFARTGEWEQARRHVEEALAADPGHLPSLRLRALALAEEGRSAEAAKLLESWLEHAAHDPLYDRAARETARLDLALMLLSIGRERDARHILLALTGGANEGRRLAALAAAEQGLEEPRNALAAARAAAAADPAAILPQVQQALLYEHWLDEPEQALLAWERALALAEGAADLPALLQRARAQVHVERLTRALAAAEEEGG